MIIKIDYDLLEEQAYMVTEDLLSNGVGEDQVDVIKTMRFMEERFIMANDAGCDVWLRTNPDGYWYLLVDRKMYDVFKGDLVAWLSSDEAWSRPPTPEDVNPATDENYSADRVKSEFNELNGFQRIALYHGYRDFFNKEYHGGTHQTVLGELDKALLSEKQELFDQLCKWQVVTFVTSIGTMGVMIDLISAG